MKASGCPSAVTLLHPQRPETGRRTQLEYLRWRDTNVVVALAGQIAVLFDRRIKLLMLNVDGLADGPSIFGPDNGKEAHIPVFVLVIALKINLISAPRAGQWYRFSLSL